MTTFSHSGKLGDVIYALPTIEALGGGHLYLSPSDALGPFCFTQEHVDFLWPLLSLNAGLTGLSLHHGREVYYNLDGFRSGQHYAYGRNLVHLHADAVGVTLPEVVPPWLSVGCMTYSSFGSNPPVIINRTRRYKNRFFPWPEVYRKYRGQCAFVGDDLDHWEFEADLGPIPRIECADALVLARVIANSRLFVGGQSLPLALAIGLGKDCVHEISPWVANCNFGRSNEWASGGGTVHLPEI